MSSHMAVHSVERASHLGGSGSEMSEMSEMGSRWGIGLVEVIPHGFIRCLFRRNQGEWVFRHANAVPSSHCIDLEA